MSERMIPGGGPVSNVPLELRERNQWVGWKREVRNGKETKVPINAATGGLASSTDYHTWTDFETALNLAHRGGCDGVGYVFSPNDPYVGIDLDDVIDPATGEVDADAAAVVDQFASYAEVSPSGTGVHIIVQGKLPPGGRKRGDREVYDHGRYFTVTGNAASPHPIRDVGSQLARWHAETFPDPGERPAAEPAAPRPPLDMTDAELVRRIEGSTQGPKFARLWAGDTSDYGSGSEADLALCSILAWWGRADAALVDRLFRNSGLMRPKWDSPRGDQTYGQRTVNRVIGTTAGGYDPEYKSGPEPTFGKGPPDNSPPGNPDDVAGIGDLKAAGATVKWVWPGWIQQGVLTAVAAEGGTGKTRFVADLVRRVRHGLPWPDGQPMDVPYTGGTVALWVVADNHHDEMVSLCDAFGISDCVKLNASKSDPYGGTTLEDASEFAALAQRIKATRPIFVAIDTVGNSTDKNLSKQEDAKAYYQPLQVIARQYGVTPLPMTHLNAGGKILGRRALEKVRVCIRLSARQVNDSTCPRRLEVIKSNSKYPAPLGVEMGDAGNEYTDTPPPAPEDDGEPQPKIGKSSKTRECTEWLRDLIAVQPRRVTEIRSEAELKGYNPKVLYQVRNSLGLEEVKSNGRTWWRMPLDAESVA